MGQYFKNFTNENASEKITVKERLAYGCGDFSSNIMYSAVAAFLMFYYTDYVGVAAAAVGVIIDITFWKGTDMDIAFSNSLCCRYSSSVCSACRVE